MTLHSATAASSPEVADPKAHRGFFYYLGPINIISDPNIIYRIQRYLGFQSGLPYVRTAVKSVVWCHGLESPECVVDIHISVQRVLTYSASNRQRLSSVPLVAYCASTVDCDRHCDKNVTDVVSTACTLFAY